tara:strand:+ start:2166 stop:2333 length:168 start_codon:yes stop_codon:yes gene_type:complete
MSEMESVAKDYNKKKSGLKWGNHIKQFYKSTRAYGLDHGDTMRQLGRVYRSGKYK